MSQYYRKHVFICINRRPEGDPKGCCWEKRSVRQRTYMKKRAKDLGLDDIRINASGCLDRCELGPTMVIYPEGVWYTFESEADIDEILQRHVIDDDRVDRLCLPATTAKEAK
jgi:(2Fe-2S) ferredoxin